VDVVARRWLHPPRVPTVRSIEPTNTQETLMTNTATARTAVVALAAAFTVATLAGTNAIAGHKYRAALAAQPVAVAVQHVTIVGHRQI
jgi:hypothetical protein